MCALAIAVAYVLFVWWFSTGTVLLLVGLSSRHDRLLKAGTATLFAASLAGVAASSQDTGPAGTYCVFTCAILLWGAVEMSLLAGWITGPRADNCPSDCTSLGRVWFALQAIAYHELALIVTAGLVLAVTTGSENQLGWWTFATLLVLRQSAKINLFLGVRMLNDELLPAQVGFLKSYFTRKPMNALFPVSVTLATSATALLAIAAVDAEAEADALALALLATLVALGALEHWFMMLPIPVVDLWRWSVRSASVKAASVPAAEPSQPPILSVIRGGIVTAERPTPPKSAALAARQRLEDQFRQAYRADKAGVANLANLEPECVRAARYNSLNGVDRAPDGRGS
jgi:putative photosynthetic complex assembly protein 2